MEGIAIAPYRFFVNAQIESLNARYKISGQLAFESGPGGFPFVRISTPLASAEICLHGGHVTAFQPNGEKPLIWLSPTATFDSKKAIRGGIPICWPWFGDHPTDPEKPAHGFARSSLWEVVSASIDSESVARVILRLSQELVPQGFFTTDFGLQLEITISWELTLSLTTTNYSELPVAMRITDALHTYLQVGDVEAVRIEGLDGITYRDKLEDFREKTQVGDVVFRGSVDRVYEGTRSAILVVDEQNERTIRVTKSGSDTTVVWNPGAEGAARLSDMPDDGYRTMVCVEAANAGQDVINLARDESHTLSTTIALA